MQVKSDLAVFAAIDYIKGGCGKRPRVAQGQPTSMLAAVEEYSSQFHRRLIIGGKSGRH
jgi:hypothetical protein